MNLQALFVFDISTTLMMMILAFLSKRLGEALKIIPFFKILYLTSLLVITSSTTDFIADFLSLPVLSLVTVAIRFISCVTAFVVCMVYWKWLFSAFKN